MVGGTGNCVVADKTGNKCGESCGSNTCGNLSYQRENLMANQL